MLEWLFSWLDPEPPPLKPFDPLTPLLTFGNDVLTLGQCFAGVSIMGEVGSGKTSGPGDQIAKSLLKAGCGFSVLCCKTNEAERWERQCKQTGRSDDFIRVQIGGPFACDFMMFESQQPGASCETLAQLLDSLVKIASRSQGGQGDEQFWMLSCQRAIRASLALVWHVTGSVGLDQVYNVFTTAPTSRAQIESVQFRAMAFCGELLNAAPAAQLPEGKRRELDLACGFWTEYATWGEKTRSIVNSMCVNILAKFIAGDVAPLVSGGVITVSPLDCLAGKVVVWDIPILQYREVGQFVQIIWDLILSRAALRQLQERPCVRWRDEAQWFVVPDQDVLTQTVAREHRLISVVLTQNLPVLLDQFGGGDKARQQVEGLLANHSTKFACANSCKQTNEFHSELFGQSRQQFHGTSMQPVDYDPVEDMMLGKGPQVGFSSNEQMQPDVRPEAFSRCRKGGKPHFEVDCYLYQGGRTWSNGKTWRRVTFKQQF